MHIHHMYMYVTCMYLCIQYIIPSAIFNSSLLANDQFQRSFFRRDQSHFFIINIIIVVRLQKLKNLFYGCRVVGLPEQVFTSFEHSLFQCQLQTLCDRPWNVSSNIIIISILFHGWFYPSRKCCFFFWKRSQLWLLYIWQQFMIITASCSLYKQILKIFRGDFQLKTSKQTWILKKCVYIPSALKLSIFGPTSIYLEVGMIHVHVSLLGKN